MYREIWEKYKQAFPSFPSLRRPLVGTVIKETRVDKGIRQMDFAKQIGMNESTLKSIENDHQQATTVVNLEKCARALDLSTDDLILMGRERDPANCFAFKRSEPPLIKGIRKRKRLPQEWHQTIRLRFQDFDVTPCSAPIRTKKDFFISRINLPPKRSIENLALPAHDEVAGFLSSGFNIKISYETERIALTGSQSFALDGFFPHTITNEDDDQAAILYLVTRLPNHRVKKPHEKSPQKRIDSVDIAYGIEQIRSRKSDRPAQPLTVKHLADLTDSLDHEQVRKLMRFKKGSSLLYWEKIEDLLSGARVSMEEFLTWCHHEEARFLTAGTASTRALIDLSTYYGLKIYSAAPPRIDREYFFGDLMIEGKSAIPKKPWERRDPSMIALFVEEGELEVTVGRHRSALPLVKGESIYFDGHLGYALRNPGARQVKCFFAAYPSIQF